MQGTHDDHNVNRPIATHGWHKPDRPLVIALIEMRLLELSADSLRRRVLEQMIERVEN